MGLVGNIINKHHKYFLYYIFFSTDCIFLLVRVMFKIKTLMTNAESNCTMSIFSKKKL